MGMAADDFKESLKLVLRGVSTAGGGVERVPKESATGGCEKVEEGALDLGGFMRFPATERPAKMPADTIVDMSMVQE